MRRKNGFTLIELLAVIVVLAIIALIATPIVMNTIKNSKKGAAERTADNYVEQVETSLMTYRLETGENLPDGEYDIDENGNLVGQGKTLTVEMSGTKPSSGTIAIENGQVKKDNSSMTIGDYIVTYDTTNKTFVASENAGSNVELLCKAVTELSTQYLFDINTFEKFEQQLGLLASEAGPYAYGVEYTCELGDNDAKTFYVLENNTDTVSLIMNTNVGSDGKGTMEGNQVWWCESGVFDNSCNAKGAIEYLKNSTSSWSKLKESQISLPSAEQIAIASGKTFSQSGFSGIPTWLYGNILMFREGYWTSTPVASSTFAAWIVGYRGSLGYTLDTYDYNDASIGIRPVITLSKSQLG